MLVTIRLGVGLSNEALAWVGQRAVAWVIDEAPVPADLAFILIVIARRCDESGCGSYQSMKTLAEKTGKSEAQARRDVKRLRELGLLLMGDQTLPGKHGVPAGKCPVVYDLPLSLAGPKPINRSKNPTGRRSEPATPRMDAPPASMRTPGMDATPPPASMPGVPPASMPSDPLHGCHPNKTTNLENKTGTTPARSPAEPEPAPRPKRKTRKERTAEQQAAFDTADRIAHLWWDEQCPQRGIPVIAKGNRSPKAAFPGFRSVVEKALDAGITETEIKNALIDCGTAWPNITALTNAVTRRRGRNPQSANGRPSNQHIESAAGDNLAEVFG